MQGITQLKEVTTVTAKMRHIIVLLTIAAACNALSKLPPLPPLPPPPRDNTFLVDNVVPRYKGDFQLETIYRQPPTPKKPTYIPPPPTNILPPTPRNCRTIQKSAGGGMVTKCKLEYETKCGLSTSTSKAGCAVITFDAQWRMIHTDREADSDTRRHFFGVFWLNTS